MIRTFLYTFNILQLAIGSPERSVSSRSFNLLAEAATFWAEICGYWAEFITFLIFTTAPNSLNASVIQQQCVSEAVLCLQTVGTLSPSLSWIISSESRCSAHAESSEARREICGESGGVSGGQCCITVVIVLPWCVTQEPSFPHDSNEADWCSVHASPETSG